MKIKILDKTINKKLFFAVLGIMLIGGIAFSVIQIVYAGYATVYTAPSPGHSWGQMANFSCPSGECLQSNSNGSLYCATCSGGSGTSYWTLSYSDLYPNSTSYNVAIGTTGAAGYKLNVYGNTRVIGGSITTTYYSGTGGTVYADQFCLSTSLGGSSYNCKTSWPTFSNFNCQRVYGSYITVDDTYATTVNCPSGYRVVRCEWASVSNRNIYPITLSSYTDTNQCVFNFKDPDFGTGQVLPAAYCCQ